MRPALVVLAVVATVALLGIAWAGLSIAGQMHYQACVDAATASYRPGDVEGGVGPPIVDPETTLRVKAIAKCSDSVL